jgi:hypothetical protein
MQLAFDSHDDGEFEAASAQNRQIDSAALRILATWIAERAGLDPETGATVDRGFVVAHAHA